jgi:hypothetical protein
VSTITPPCGTAGPCFTPTTGLCASGTIAQDTTAYTNWGIGVGCNLSQSQTIANDPAHAVTLPADGVIHVTLAANSGVALPTSLRVKVTGSDTAATAYCGTLTLTNGTGSVALTSLKSLCWTTGGVAFNPATMPVVNVEVDAVSNTTAPIPFNFCVSDLQITGGGSTGTGGAPGTGGAAATGGTAGGVSASGGVPAASGGTAAATGGAGGSGPANSVTIQTGGYYQMSTTFGGYCFTSSATASVINPPCGTAGPCFTPSTGLCVNGTAAQDTTAYTNWGVGVGCNLSQSQTIANDPAHLVSLPGTGSISVTLSPNGGTTLPTSLRVKVVVSASVSYCATLALTGGSGSVPLTSLNTTCWSPTTGTYFNPATTQVTAVEVDVTTNLTSAVPFNFCVQALSIS